MSLDRDVAKLTAELDQLGAKCREGNTAQLSTMELFMLCEAAKIGCAAIMADDAKNDPDKLARATELMQMSIGVVREKMAECGDPASYFAAMVVSMISNRVEPMLEKGP